MNFAGTVILYNSPFCQDSFSVHFDRENLDFCRYLLIIAIIDKFCAFAHIPKKTLHLQGCVIEL